ncbi:MAG: hypothetical protein K6A72_08050 [Lachnospiraceae bacterium]|nr:hypothetical protein [Lachnospiraceae bacterium]
MNNNKRKFPHEMTKKELIFYILFVIIVGLFFFFTRDDLAGKLILIVVCPMVIGYLVYAYNKERKADKNAGEKKSQIIDGSYFENPKWKAEYVRYINEHPFERPVYQDMKMDLLKRFRRGEYIKRMIFLLFLIAGTGCTFFLGHYATGIIGFVIFGVLFYLEFALYIGMPVIKWLRGDIDYNMIQSSYKNSQMLVYKKNGLAFGTAYIHGFTEKKIYAIEYRLAEGISRKIVRLKTYEDGIYSKDEYQHFAVIHVRVPDSDNLYDVEIELNEFQVQMAIDRFFELKLGAGFKDNILINEKKENEITV